MTLFETNSIKDFIQISRIKRNMNKLYFRFRIFLMMLAFGLASVSFFSELYENWTEIPVKLPQVESSTPIYILPIYKHEMKKLGVPFNHCMHRCPDD